MESMLDIQRDRLADKIGCDRHTAELSVPGLLRRASDFIAEQDEIIKQHEGVKARAEIEAEIEKVDHDIAFGREGRSCGELLERKRGLQSVLINKPTGGEGG